MKLCNQLPEYRKPGDTHTAWEPVFNTEPLVKSQENHCEVRSTHIQFKTSLESHRKQSPKQGTKSRIKTRIPNHAYGAHTVLPIGHLSRSSSSKNSVCPRVWDIKLKLVGPDNSVVVTRGEGVGRGMEGPWYMVIEDWPWIVGKQTNNTDFVSWKSTLETYIILLTDDTQ